MPDHVEVFDTTLRDGSQMEGLSLTVDDKLRVAEQLDWLGLHYIEAGWARANPQGAEVLVLCDTNGGTLPHEAERIVGEVAPVLSSARLGVHFHDDSGCGVANALAAVRAGATHVQGCVNGYGERTGNANLTTIIAALALKMGVHTIPPDR